MREPSRAAPDAAPAQQVRYEGYGPGGAAVLLECVTSDRQRTAAELRRLFSSGGGRLGASGSVAYLFNEVGVLHYEPSAVVPGLVSAALDAGAEDVVADRDGSVEVLTDPIDFGVVRAALGAAGYRPLAGAVIWRAAGSIELDSAQGSAMLALLEVLEKFDDVQSIYTNAAIPDEVLESI